MLVCLVAAFLELVVNSYTPGTGLMEHYRQASIRKDAGGLLGGAQVQLLCPMLGVVGYAIAIVILAVISVILITERSLLKPLSHGGKRVYEDAKIRHETAAIRAAKKKGRASADKGSSVRSAAGGSRKERVQKQNEEKKESKKARRQDQKFPVCPLQRLYQTELQNESLRKFKN